MHVPVAIVGASGYTGAELLRLLLEHPRVEIAALYARASAGSRISDVFPHLEGRLDLPIEAFDADDAAFRARIVFCCLPHGDSAAVVSALVDRGVVVIDLSADFRLRDADVYARWYGSEEQPEHPAPDKLARAVYGLPERYRAAIVGAGLIACPGCYPTGAILAIAPLLQAGLVSPDGIIVDSKSGISGAGRALRQTSHFSEMGESVRAYAVAGAHRHTSEIEQELSCAAGACVRIMFTPHVVPMTRGILSCVYAQPTSLARTEGDYQRALEDAYQAEPFVTVLPPGTLPDTAHIRVSNRAHVAVRYDERAQRVIAVSAIDNLVKGASGQAVQCMNLSQGFPETMGLGAVGAFP